MKDEDIVVPLLQEVWSNRTEKVIRATIKDFGFDSKFDIRTKRRGGGLAIIYRPELNVKKLQPGLFTTLEIQKFDIINGKKERHRIFNAYRPPYNKLNPHTNKVFLDELESFFEITDFDRTTFVGDLNIRIIRNV